MLRTLYWILLYEGRARVNVIIVFKALNNIVYIPYNYLPRSTRNLLNLFISFDRHDAYFYSFYPSSMRVWNVLPTDFQVLYCLTHFQRYFEGHALTSLFKRLISLYACFLHYPFYIPLSIISKTARLVQIPMQYNQHICWIGLYSESSRSKSIVISNFLVFYIL